MQHTCNESLIAQMFKSKDVLCNCSADNGTQNIMLNFPQLPVAKLGTSKEARCLSFVFVLFHDPIIAILRASAENTVGVSSSSQ